MKTRPDCFGEMDTTTIVWKARACDTCPRNDACDTEMLDRKFKRGAHKEIKRKKPLDQKWVAELMSYMLGPQITIMTMHSPATAKTFTEVVKGAVNALYEQEDYPDTNAWVVAASNRVWDLYNTFMTAKLIKMFDDGVPDKPIIHLAPGSGMSN